MCCNTCLPPLHLSLRHLLLAHARSALSHCHAIWIGIVLSVTGDLLHSHARDTLCLRHRAVFVGKQKRLKPDNLFT